ncbi:MAG: response regulator [Chloroflexota bacterium]
MTSVLIVEDERIVAKSLQSTLQAAGYDVPAVVATGEAALQAIARTQPDLVLMDIRLEGGMDGITAARHVRFDYDVPVIYLTAYSDRELLEQAKTSEPIGYLVKPFEDEDLLTTIEIALHQYTANYRRTETALWEQEARFRAIFEKGAVGIGLADMSGRFLETNAALQNMLGYSAAELRGLSFLEVTHPDERDRDGKLFAELVAGQRDYYQVEKRYVRKDGRVVWGRPNVSLVRDSHGQPQFAIGVVDDITERKEAEERSLQQERLAAVGQLAAGIAHDFNNIMAVIVLHSQLLQRARSLSEKDRQRLATIHQQANHASRLIQQILDFSHRSTMERGPLDVLPLLKEMVKLWQRTLPENVRLHLSYDQDEYVLNGDPTRLEQVFMNLAVNARDAMPNGGALEIRLARLNLLPEDRPPVPGMLPGAWLSLSFSDTGAGILPGVLPHIFEPFFTTKVGGRGTGLGLAQVYGIVHQHDGYITVESQPGWGTTFTIFLPLLAEGIETAVAPEAPIHVTGAATVLVVEDELPVREALRETLLGLGFRVWHCSDGPAALRLFNQRGPEIDLVLSDLVMPGMSGLELFQSLKARRPDVRMMMMTGYPLAGGGDALLEQGVLDWLPKPFTADQLAQKIEAALGHG